MLTPPGTQPGALVQPATTSINPWVAPVRPASSSMCAADAAPARIPSCAANLDSLRPRPSSPVTVARSKVLQRSRSQQPSVSTPINIEVLEHELLPHPDRTFVNYLLNSLRFGTHIGYTGPQSPRVSHNLLSASQHPEVVTRNLAKEVNLGRVAGPFTSPPLPDLQCHPVGHHLSYPEGVSINDYNPKDPYSLQYVQVDDAIRVLKSLGPGSHIAKTDLKSAFRLIPIHPDD